MDEPGSNNKISRDSLKHVSGEYLNVSSNNNVSMYATVKEGAYGVVDTTLSSGEGAYASLYGCNTRDCTGTVKLKEAYTVPKENSFIINDSNILTSELEDVKLNKDDIFTVDPNQDGGDDNHLSVTTNSEPQNMYIIPKNLLILVPASRKK